jgi:phosphocarrier protein
MVKKRIFIKNKLGLHARAAVKFVNLANRFVSSVKISSNDTEVDGKSILGILTLAAVKGTEIVLVASGEDEEETIEALETLIYDKFGEKE